LSIVEAMAYGKPVVTFKRSPKTLQCVEYHYLKDGFNAVILNEDEDYISDLQSIPLPTVESLGVNARNYVRHNLQMSNMAQNAIF